MPPDDSVTKEREVRGMRLRKWFKASGCFSSEGLASRHQGFGRLFESCKKPNDYKSSAETSDEFLSELIEVPEDYEANSDSETLEVRMIGCSKPRRFLVLRKEPD